MLKTFKTKDRVGTVGCRLHFSNNTVQHDGISIILRQKHKAYTLDHLNRETYYKFNTGIDEVGGNTAALIMIRKKVFETMGGFNESFKHCYEDAILGLQLIKNGYYNYCNGECVAYHHESQTREVENNKLEMMQDFNEHVYPFIKENFEKFKKYTVITN